MSGSNSSPDGRLGVLPNLLLRRKPTNRDGKNDPKPHEEVRVWSPRFRAYYKRDWSPDFDTTEIKRDLETILHAEQSWLSGPFQMVFLSTSGDNIGDIFNIKKPRDLEEIKLMVMRNHDRGFTES